ncbi:MAG: ABC transporter substrate-binding protein [Clostridiales bacterium]|nr:ABC transporter substrate-binding protein [Clostridiales bacterium]
MKKGLTLILICLFLFSSFACCESAVSFVDDTGMEIDLVKKPSRVAVLFSSFADMWLLSGGHIYVTVGEAVERGFAEENTLLVDSGAGKKIDVEALFMSEPDLIIGSADIPFHEKARQMIKNTSVPFALFHVESIEDYLRVFEIMTSINNTAENYIKYGEIVQKEAMKVIKHANEYANKEPQEILFIRSGSGYSSAKAKTRDMHFAAQMLYDLGAKNIADDIPIIIDGLSFEEIFMKDPDAIFISLMGDEQAAKAYMNALFNKPEWRMLRAVQNGRCYFLSKELFQFKPNARWAEAYLEMAKMLYPDWEEAWGEE